MKSTVKPRLNTSWITTVALTSSFLSSCSGPIVRPYVSDQRYQPPSALQSIRYSYPPIEDNLHLSSYGELTDAATTVNQPALTEQKSLSNFSSTANQPLQSLPQESEEKSTISAMDVALLFFPWGRIAKLASLSRGAAVARGGIVTRAVTQGESIAMRTEAGAAVEIEAAAAASAVSKASVHQAEKIPLQSVFEPDYSVGFEKAGTVGY